VGRVGEVRASADPREAARSDGLHERRKDRRVPHSPDEARAEHDGLEAVAVRRDDDLLGLRLGRAVQRLGVRSQGLRLVDAHQRLPRHQLRLGADVDEAADPRGARGVERVAGARDVAALELGAAPPLAQMRRRVERELAALGTGAHRVGVVEVAAHRLGAPLGHDRGRPLGARKPADAPAVAGEALDQASADEPRATGHERGARAAVHRPTLSARRPQPNVNA
jgi:hypothetical protein